MDNLKDLYNKNINLMNYLRNIHNVEENEADFILKSYDLQAGSYVEAFNSNETITNSYIDNVKQPTTLKNIIDCMTTELARNINELGEFSSILDAGIGEATFLVPLADRLNNKNIDFYGFDISASRINVANKFSEDNNLHINTFVGDMNYIPLPDKSIDIVYTAHAIEPNTNNEKNIIKELFRITNKYLICIEPSYNLGNQETKKNIDKHKYIKNLKREAENLDGEIIKYELFPCGTYNNQSEIIIIKKEAQKSITDDTNYVCPVCREELKLHKNNFYCKNCLCVYPILDNIPILLPGSRIIYSKYIEE